MSFQPFYADDVETAEALLQAAISKFPAENVQFFLPTENTHALALVKKYFNIFEYRPGNAWLANRKEIKIETSRIYSILDYCFAVC